MMRRGTTILEVLAVLLVVLVLISFLFRMNQSEIADDLAVARM